MQKDISKTEAKETIEKFFYSIKDKKPEGVRKIKKIAMKHRIKLGKNKRLFCKKCFSVFNSQNSQIRIKKGMKTIKCKKCMNVSRSRLN
jgi:predicted Zn finger-like uncharacterized protein